MITIVCPLIHRQNKFAGYFLLHKMLELFDTDENSCVRIFFLFSWLNFRECCHYFQKKIRYFYIKDLSSGDIENTLPVLFPKTLPVTNFIAHHKSSSPPYYTFVNDCANTKNILNIRRSTIITRYCGPGSELSVRECYSHLTVFIFKIVICNSNKRCW